MVQIISNAWQDVTPAVITHGFDSALKQQNVTAGPLQVLDDEDGIEFFDLVEEDDNS